MAPGKGNRKLSERARERRNEMRRRRRRKSGAIKKVHNLKVDCGIESALILIYPETNKIFTYASTNEHELWTPWFGSIVSRTW